MTAPQRIQRQRTKGWRTPLCSCGCGKPAVKKASTEHCLDTWGVMDSASEVRAVNLNRWTPETRSLIREAREALRQAEDAMRRETKERGLWR